MVDPSIIAIAIANILVRAARIIFQLKNSKSNRERCEELAEHIESLTTIMEQLKTRAGLFGSGLDRGVQVFDSALDEAERLIYTYENTPRIFLMFQNVKRKIKDVERSLQRAQNQLQFALVVDQHCERNMELMPFAVYEPYLMEAGVSGLEGPPHNDGPDDITLAKQRTCMEVKHPGTAASRDLEHEETRSGITILCQDHPDEDIIYKEDVSATNTAGANGGQSFHHGRQSPVPSVISMKSDRSMGRFVQFTGEKDITSPLTTAPGAILCAVCPKRAFKSCLTCMASFCGDHVKPHYTAPELQRHRLVDATEDLDDRLCQRHNRELELYCDTDQTAICALCVKEHRGHDVTDLEEHQGLRKSVSNMTTAVPPPGPIEFYSVKPDSVCVRWGPPEGLTVPHTFRVTWTAEGKPVKCQVQGQKLHVQELSPGEKYTFTVATLMDDGRESWCVAATTHTDVPPPEDLAVKVDLPSASVSWSRPAGVDQASYLLTLSTDGECIDTFSVKSLQHSIAGLLIGEEYTITVSAVLNGRQSQPVSKPIRTSIPAPEDVHVGSVTPPYSRECSQILHRFLISYNSEGTELQTM